MLLSLIAALTVLLAAGFWLLLTRYPWVAGNFREQGSEPMDLRGESLSLAGFEKLTEKFPGREILWDVPLQGGRVPSDASSVAVSAPTEADWQALELLPNLTRLDVTDCRDYAPLLSFQSAHPDCQVNYSVPLAGQEYPGDAQSITVTDGDAAELERVLPCLPRLTQVELTGRLPVDDDLRRLVEGFPEILFRWPLRLGDTTVDRAASELDLRGQSVSCEGIRYLMDWMPNLERVNLTGCPLTDSQVMLLADDYPGREFLWAYRIAGKSFPSDAEEIDLSGQKLSDTRELEALLPYFPRLKTVTMCGCGLDNETMDALNRRYENIRFIWSVRIQDVEIRTDAKWFYPFKYRKDMVVSEEDLYPLRYCTDMEAIDIGHMTTVKTCQWAAYMPNLKYLVIIETAITDLTPLSGLKNLVFLEIFTTNIRDYSPLLGCTGLEDLNLGLTYGDPAPILQMTWLKNLWWCGIEGSQGLVCSDAPQRLREALPNTNLKFNMETPNVNNGWRQLENYYAMRDLMDVFYLT